MTEFNHLYY